MSEQGGVYAAQAEQGVVDTKMGCWLLHSRHMLKALQERFDPTAPVCQAPVPPLHLSNGLHCHMAVKPRSCVTVASRSPHKSHGNAPQ